MAIPVVFSPSAAGAALYAGRSNSSLSGSQQRLASGSRISDPSEDPSSSAIGAKFSSQISTLAQLGRNTSTALTVTQFMIGELQTISSILSRMLTLSAQSNSDTVSDNERKMLDLEFQQLTIQINSISDNTKWLSTSLLNSTTGSLTFQVGLTNTVTVSFQSINVNATSSTMLAGTGNIQTASGASSTYNTVNTAINNIGQNIATIGAIKSRFKYINDDLAVELTNKSAAQSSITDADVMTELQTVQSLQGLFDMASAMFKQALRKQSELAQIVQDASR
jgi:flagellin